jgi:hypothetical protein
MPPRATSIFCALPVLLGSCSSPEIMSLRPRDDAAVPEGDDLPRDAAVRAQDAAFVFDPGDASPLEVKPAAACPGMAGALPRPCAELMVAVDPYYAANYTCYDLGPVPGLPPQKYGGLTLTLDRCSTKLLIGGRANQPDGNLYSVDVLRDATGHVSGFSGMATVFAAAPSNDGGVAFGPGNVLFLTRWPTNELQQTKPGSRLADKVIDLAKLNVAHSSASLAFVPMTFPSPGALKLVSWGGGQWYTFDLEADGQGTYDITGARQELTLPGGPEGFVYVAEGSPNFARNSLLVSEWTANSISTYETDEHANPRLDTRRAFITGLDGAEGAYRDPATGDFFFSTWGQADDRVIVVRGFAPIPIIQ